MVSRQEHRVWPIRVAGQIRNVKQEAVLIAEPRRDRGCPSAQSIADPRKSAIPEANERYSIKFRIDRYLHRFALLNSVKSMLLKPASLRTYNAATYIHSTRHRALIRDGIVSYQRLTFQLAEAEADLMDTFNFHNDHVRLAGRCGTGTVG